MKSKIQLLSRVSRRWFTFASVSLAALACGGGELEHQDLGNTSAAVDSDPNARTPLLTIDGASGAVSDVVIDPFIVGHWVGQADDLFSSPGPDGARPSYTFPSGSQQIALDLSLFDALHAGEQPGLPSPDTQLMMAKGQIVFGEGMLPEAEAGVVYPPGIHLPPVVVSDPNATLTAGPPIEGFAYDLVARPSRPSDGEGALPLSFDLSEAYASWCPLQSPTPSPLVPGRYDCFPTTAGNEGGSISASDPTTGALISWDPLYQWACQACACTALGCMPANGVSVIQVWLTRSGPDLLGTLVNAAFDYGSAASSYLPIGTVRFQRQAQ